MARYDLFAFDGRLVVDLQADIVEIPGSRVVAPVLPEAEVPPMTKTLHPRVMINGMPFLVATHLMAATPEALLKERVGSLSAYADDLMQALDVLFQGH